MMKNQQTIKAGSEALWFSDDMTQRALKITSNMNSGYHTPKEVRAMLAELTGKQISDSVYLIPPFYTDFGLNISLGQRIYINMGCTMQDQGGIEIGDGTQIGHHVTMVTINHDEDPQHRGDLHPKPIRIGKNVWIGANATILPGVQIGDGAIIAAGAVVCKNVEANTVAAGIPARIIKGVKING